ncbi:hypothetical protein [Agrococcus sp. DT81.2]|uniref:hypothetical protein n=1 Tax=Agrococcus sp. DT81.2 TaxID=3393414 RepID=UPI003CE44E10
MNSIWILVIIALGIVAAASTISVLIGQRAPRVAPDPERLALLRDRFTELQAQQRIEHLEERVAEERDARSAAPQRRSGQALVSTERLWAGGL